MKRPFLMLGLLAILSASTAMAQPAPDAAPIAPNPPNGNGGAQMTPEQQAAQMEEVMKKAQAEGIAIMKLPPDQMRARLRQMQVDGLRMEMDRLGFKEKVLQDRVVKFVDDQEKSREQVRAAGLTLYQAMTAKDAVITDQALTGLIEDYLGAAQDTKSERAAASEKLDAEIGWSQKPRLRAFLAIKGIIGEESWLVEDLLMAGNMSVGSLAGFGLPPGGRR